VIQKSGIWQGCGPHEKVQWTFVVGEQVSKANRPEGRREFAPGLPAPKQRNLNKLGDAGGCKGAGLLTPPKIDF
jgi:hypothetical protein